MTRLLGWGVAAVWAAGIWATVLSSHFVNLGFRDKWMPMILVAAVAVVVFHRLAAATWRFVNPGMLVILLWAVVSTAWTPAPGVVVTQALSLVGASMMGLAFGLPGWTPDRFERNFAWTTGALLLASMITAFAFPSIGIHSETGISLQNAWRGVTIGHTALGQATCLGMIAWTYLWVTRRVPTWFALSGLGVATIVLIEGRSSTSIMLAMISCVAVYALARPVISIGNTARRGIFAAGLVAIPLVIYAAVQTSYLGFIGGFFGKDGTFSGRKQIWDAVLLEVADRPWFGTGLAGFWRGMDAGEARVQAAVGWEVINGHNGYLDLVNELGLVGLGLFLIFLVYHCIALAKLARVSRRHFALHLPLFVYLILANISESGWFFPISLTHLVIMYSSMEISRLLLADALLSRYPAPRTTDAMLPISDHPPTASPSAALARSTWHGGSREARE